MSNVFLSTSIIYLASKEAGCVDENDEIILDCETHVYGFYPSSFVTNIAALGGLLAAFLMPLIGAIVDYTSHRWNVGWFVAVAIFILQLIQIGTVSATWFPMAKLQAIVGALFYLHYLLMVSYLPDIARYDVDVPTMTRFNRSFFGLQFGGEVVYILLVVGISIGVDFNSVQTGQLGQLVGSLWIGVGKNSPRWKVVFSWAGILMLHTKLGQSMRVIIEEG
jgi:MFS-type transporter involved in bile tolerance (Atg22 family)